MSGGPAQNDGAMAGSVPFRQGRGSAPQKRLYTIPEAGRYLGRTEGAIRELIWKGVLPAVKIDRRVQVDVADMDMLIERSKVVEWVQ